ncbi:hypothetical protein T492DRAFT_219872 [Pavlovales sp. CCMP2436]|nr:hypothetical protein T492DRAFT_219872 [Pavlovales sp. CCMP2436]
MISHYVLYFQRGACCARSAPLTLTSPSFCALDLITGNKAWPTEINSNMIVFPERRSLRTLRAAHTRELTSRTELELFLRQCIADVKAQLDRVVTLLYDKTFPKMAAAQETWQAGMFKEDSQLASPMGSNSNFESELIR